MTSADQYRVKAAEYEALAQSDLNPFVCRELQLLAKAYRRLSELADRNLRTDIVYEPPFSRPDP
jgi:hypothetical protein